MSVQSTMDQPGAQICPPRAGGAFLPKAAGPVRRKRWRKADLRRVLWRFSASTQTRHGPCGRAWLISGVGMVADTLDRLLTALAVRLHAFSVCEIQQGWRLAYPSFEAITVHYVLKGAGAFCVGNGPWLPFAPQSVIVVPVRQSHVLGEAGTTAQTLPAGDHCSLLADGLVKFTAGDGSRDILLLCGAIPTAHGNALGLFDLLREPMVESFAASGLLRHAFELMLAEVANPGLGT